MTKMLVNFVQEVNASKIRNETLDGAEYVVMPSQTMPDDVVLNGILYPASSIDATIKTIDGSPAPIDHPKIDGQYVSAYDPRAALEYGAGVNKYIGKEGNIHKVEKWFNKEILNNTDRGRRLLQAIATNKPIHSSTGVILSTNDESGENQYGAYNKVATIDHFDHDAALPDSIGAGTPEATGTGIQVNSQTGEKEEFEVLFVNLTSGDDFSGSANETRSKLREAVRSYVNPNNMEDIWAYVEDFNSDTVIYEINNKLMAIQYLITDGVVNLVGEAKETRAKTVFEFNSASDELGFFHKLAKKLGFNVKSTSKHNESEGDEMKLIKDKLVELGVNHEGLSDTDTLALYNKSILAESRPEVNTLTAADVAKIVTDTLAANEETKAKSDKEALVTSIIANTKYTEEDKEMLLNTDSRLLNSFLPQPRAAGLGHPAPLQANESSIANDTMPE